MTDLNLDDVRLKGIAELTEDEKSFLKDNVGNLSDEEKETFHDVIEPPTGGGTSGGGEEFKFKTKEEFDAAVVSAVKTVTEEAEQARKEAEEEAKRKSTTETFFPENYKAKDWNDAANILFPKFRDKVVAEIQEMSSKQRQKLDEINKGFDEETEKLRQAHPEIPPRGTDEREAFDTELANTAVKYKLSNMTDAFGVYSALQSKGSGGETHQTNIAKKVGHGGGTATGANVKKYSHIASTSMDNLISEALEKEGIK